jgi:hypothetical protein
VVRVDVRTDVGGLVPRVALPQRGRPGDEPLGEVRRDRGLDEQPRARQAHLSGVVVLLDGEVHGEVEVGVREHQERGLSAQFEAGRDQVDGGRGGDAPGAGDRAGEADPPYVGMGDKRGAGFGAVSLDHVEHAGGEPGLGGDVGQQRRGQRRPLGWFEHDGVAGGERRGDLPGGQHQRGVPRGDQHARAGRIPRDVVGVAAGVEVVVAQAGQPIREKAEVVRDPRHHAAQVRAEQGTVVGGLHRGQFR